MKKIKYIYVGIILLILLVSATGSLAIAIRSDKNQPLMGAELEVTTDKKFYLPGEPVGIFLTNVGDETLSCGGPLVTIYNNNNEIVYQDACYCWWELKPGESIIWPLWDQTDRHGNQVPIGKYVVEGILYGDEEYIDTATFYIVGLQSIAP